jgi:RNA polymerase sigma-70 factor (sigma-E family)
VVVRVRDAGFREFVVATQPRLLAFAELVTADRGRAEDLLQEAYLAAFAAWPRIHDQAPDAYVRRCIVNGRISWWRRRSSHERPTDQTAALSHAVTSDETHTVDDRLQLLAALRRLTTRERTVVALRFFVGLTESEIAAEVGIAPGTVKSTAARAVAKLREDVLLREGVSQ